MGSGTSCNRCSLKGYIADAEKADEVILVRPTPRPKPGSKDPYLGGYDVVRWKPGGRERKIGWFWALGKDCECEGALDLREEDEIAEPWAAVEPDADGQ